MAKIAFRGLFARKLRLGLTAFAVAIGVTLIAGSYVFTDTINSAFSRIFTEVNKGVDVAITPAQPVKNDQGTQPTIPASLLAKVKAHTGVSLAAGAVTDNATSYDAKGHKLNSGNFGGLVGSVSPVPRFRGSEIKTGRWPQAPGEAALDSGTASRKHIKLGDTIAVQAAERRQTLRVVGTTEVAGVGSVGGGAFVTLTLPEAQKVLGKVGRYDQIQVAARPGVTPTQLSSQLKRALGAGVVVRTGQEEARKQTSDLKSNLSFLTTALVAFGGIALFVGAFIIFNTFSITVTQRMREFALLRTLGAKRGQLLREVIGEGFVLGLTGSVIGLGLGILTAQGLKALFKGVGVDLPSNGTVIATRTVVVALVVGTLVTVISSISPALRATRVPPVEALREGAAPTVTRLSRRLTIAASLVLVVGVALMSLGLFGSGSPNARLGLMGGGAGLTFLAVAGLSPRLVRPLASLVGAPFARHSVTGLLARENSVRQPGRTAATAAALMIGVALVTFSAIFAAGADKTIAKAVDENLSAQLVVQSKDNFSGFSNQAMRDIARVDGVSAASPVRFSKAKARGIKGDLSVSGVDPLQFAKLYRINLQKGDERTLAALRGRPLAVVSKTYAQNHDIQRGRTLLLTTPIGKHVPVTVVGEFDDKGGLMGALGVDVNFLQSAFGETKDAFGLVGVAAGANVDQVKQRIKTLLDRQYPSIEVLTAQEFKDNQAGQVNQLLGLIYALLALAIIVSLIGIVNTLVLSISERTRELGMLRAIGTSRKQVKSMIRIESVITALIGGILGLVLGTVLSILFTRPLDGFVLSIPVVTLIVVLILAGVAGVIAAALPARRAARLDVLDALAYE